MRKLIQANSILVSLNKPFFMKISRFVLTFGPDAQNRIQDARSDQIDGALALLESFYYAFNNRDQQVMKEIWLDVPFSQLNGPGGDMRRGAQDILAGYGRIFNSKARIWLKFTGIVCYAADDLVVFTGTETGELSMDGETVAVKVSATTCFAYNEERAGWVQLHHHGSFDDPGLLLRYQELIGK